MNCYFHEKTLPIIHLNICINLVKTIVCESYPVLTLSSNFLVRE